MIDSFHGAMGGGAKVSGDDGKGKSQKQTI